MITLFVSWLLPGCTGSPEVVPEASDPVVSARPPFPCPEGAKLRQNATGKGSEQFCELDGMMHGSYVRMYADGTTRAAKGAYDASAPDGDWTWWHENGQESQKGKYVKGRQVGAWTRWHANGTREEEGDYLSGRKAGLWTTYYESGRRRDSGIYQNDMKNGLWSYWFDNEENTLERTERWEGGLMKEEKIVNKEPPAPKAPAP